MYHCHSSRRISIFKPIYKKLLKEGGKKGIPRASRIDFFYSKQRDSPTYMIYHNHLICLTPLKKEQWIQKKVLTCKNIIILQVFCCLYGPFSLSNMTYVVSIEKLKMWNSNSCHSREPGRNLKQPTSENSYTAPEGRKGKPPLQALPLGLMY